MRERGSLVAGTVSKSYPAECAAALSVLLGVPRKRICAVGYASLSSSAMATAG